MSINQLGSANHRPVPYVEHCDNSASTYVNGKVGEIMGRNLPENIFLAIRNLPGLVLSAVTFPYSAYVYFTRPLTPTEEACEQIQSKPVEIFDATNQLGLNALGQAALTNQTEVFEVYSQVGVNPHQRTFANFSTTLHSSVIQGNSQIAKGLLSNFGVNPNATDVNLNSAVHLAALSNQPQILQMLIDALANLKAVNLNGQTPALLAAANSLECFQMLIDQGVSFNNRDSNGAGAWHYAVANPNSELVMAALYKLGLPIKQLDKDGNSPMHLAAKSGNEKAIQNLAHYGLELDLLNLDGLTPLHLAVMAGQEGAVRTFLQEGASVNIKTADGSLPLVLAAAGGFSSIVQMLINAGADLTNNSNGYSALYVALKRGHEDVAEILKRNGASLQTGFEGLELLKATATGDAQTVTKLLQENVLLNQSDFEKQTALMIAIMRRDNHLTKILIEACLNNPHLNILSTRDIQGQLPIHVAVKTNNLSALEILATHDYGKMGLDVADNKGLTPLLMASMNGWLEGAEILIKNGALPSIIDGAGQSSFHHAAINGDEKLLELLFKVGNLGVNWTDNEGHTPLYYAETLGHHALTELLLKNGASFSYDPIQKLILGNMKPSEGDFLALSPREQFRAFQTALEVDNNLVSFDHVLKAGNPILDYRDGNGQTLLLTAAKKNNMQALLELVKRGASVTTTDKKGLSALHYAAMHGNTEAILLLALAGANLEATQNEGIATPLLIAIAQGHQETIELLTQLGAVFDPRQPHEMRPKENYAILNLIRKGDLELLKEFFQNGGNPNVVDSKGYSMLHNALLEHASLDILEVLLQVGVDLNLKAPNGQTALHLATLLRNEAAVGLFLEYIAKQSEIDPETA